MDPKNLDPELRAKVEACITPEEVLALAKEHGYTLTDDELEQISGGDFWGGPTCPGCGSVNVEHGDDFYNYRCCNCGRLFN